jgi:hypothetical protein
MIIIISLIYVACVLVAFRVIKIKVSATSVAVAALIGVILLGGIADKTGARIGAKTEWSAGWTVAFEQRMNMLPVLSALMPCSDMESLLAACCPHLRASVGGVEEGQPATGT